MTLTTFGRPINSQIGDTLAGQPYAQSSFCLEAVAGQTYDITVRLETLEDSYLEITGIGSHAIMAENDDNGADFGSRLLWTAPTTGPVLLLVSSLDENPNAGSFSIEVETGAAEDPCAAGGLAMVENEGTISFSEGYEADALCEWDISCPDGGVVTFAPAMIDLESGYDYLSLFDDLAGTPSQIHKLSGCLNAVDCPANSNTAHIIDENDPANPIVNSPDPLVSSGPGLLVRFTADGSVGGQGFEASFRCGDPPAPQPEQPGSVTRLRSPPRGKAYPGRIESFSEFFVGPLLLLNSQMVLPLPRLRRTAHQCLRPALGNFHSRPLEARRTSSVWMWRSMAPLQPPRMAAQPSSSMPQTG